MFTKPKHDMASIDNPEITSLKRQLKNLRKSLLTVQEQQAKFVDPNSIPPDLMRNEEGLRKSIERIEARAEEIQARSRASAGQGARAVGQPKLTDSMIVLSSAARRDCAHLSIKPEEPLAFLLREATSHPILFEAEFASMPLVFKGNVLLLSWDGSEATVERILARQEAYPLNDAWSACLAVYRRTTLLSYRTKSIHRLKSAMEAKKTLASYRELIVQADQLIRVVLDNGQTVPAAYQGLSALVDEAEFAFSSSDVTTCLLRLEVVLSTVHKLLLQFAPQGPTAKPTPSEHDSAAEKPFPGKTSVLLVDDEYRTLTVFADVLRRSGYEVLTATTSSDALRAIVDHEFDLVITDLMMGFESGMAPEADGREVVLAVKKSSTKTKVIVFTAYMEMSKTGALFLAGADDVVSKMNPETDLLERVRALIGAPRADQG